MTLEDPLIVVASRRAPPSTLVSRLSSWLARLPHALAPRHNQVLERVPLHVRPARESLSQ
jgi:hypothetical protein